MAAGHAGEAIREYVIPATLAIGAAVLGLFLMVAYRASNLKDEAETNSQRARYLELFDPITGLVNRTTFIKQLEQIAGSQACQLILLDIDDFSAINEELGHRAGDQVILDFGKQLLKEFQGSQCLVSRLDGDEFAVLIVGNSDVFTLGPEPPASPSRAKRGMEQPSPSRSLPASPLLRNMAIPPAT